MKSTKHSSVGNRKKLTVKIVEDETACIEAVRENAKAAKIYPLIMN